MNLNYKQYLIAVLTITVIGFLPFVFGTSCEQGPMEEETTADTCLIAEVIMQPSEVYTTVGSSQIKFSAAAYDHDGRRIDPPPTFDFTCSTRSVRFNSDRNFAYLTPLTSFSSVIQVKAKCYDCDGLPYSATSEVWVSTPTN
ncbi:MAG: hypothetical protein ACLFSQ_11460 [Candidatus Zixiibacteriota bacterium]